ncbi:PE family protein [Nocardia puris]|uniref:PE family protein n=1 Tax=Nocardia puris TaxID=208602 RepID=A0A366DFR5_9NOCA|nr:PE family protein [Nocardia puris]MBF6211546.1 PE family protein [Nocardia puris]MBF6366798.1 PE family protein [Nocardia puris]MBF6461139.1 PE family protein [Nocardia puris]RBO88912.1 PE family protein [Nocardia puris]
MEFDPTRAGQAAAALDALVARLEHDLTVDGPALAVPAPGADEVSLRVAQTLSTVGSSYREAAANGVLEMRKLAATLRSQSADMVGMDAGNADALGAAAG